MDRCGGLVADHRFPRSHAPPRNQSVPHVGIATRERFGGRRRISLKQQDGSVDWILERTAQDELFTGMGLPCEREMLVPERGAPFDVIGDHVVEKEVMHPWPSYFFFAGAAALASTS